MYKNEPKEKEDTTNSTVILHRLLEELIGERAENGQPEIPEFSKNPPVLKGYKTLPKYSKFLARVNSKTFKNNQFINGTFSEYAKYQVKISRCQPFWSNY